MIEKDLIEIYKDNMFLLKAENKDLWFSVMSPLDSDYYKRTFAILTAWNPNNKPTTDTENSTANTKLKADLSKYEVLDSIGKYNDHEEESFLVYDISGYFTLFFHPFHSQPSTFMSLKQASKIVS